METTLDRIPLPPRGKLLSGCLHVKRTKGAYLFVGCDRPKSWHRKARTVEVSDRLGRPVTALLEEGDDG